MNPEGGGVSAWPSARRVGGPRRGDPRGLSRRGGADRARQRRRRRPDRRTRRRRARASATGSSPSSRARSGTRRSSPRRSRAPPAAFVAQRARKCGSNRRRHLIAWQPAPSANAPVTYSVVLDGHLVPTPPAPSRWRSTRAASETASTRCRSWRPTHGRADADRADQPAHRRAPAGGQGRRRPAGARRSRCASPTRSRACAPPRSGSASATAAALQAARSTSATRYATPAAISSSCTRQRQARQPGHRPRAGERAMRRRADIPASCACALSLAHGAACGRADVFGPISLLSASPLAAGRLRPRPARSPPTAATWSSTARSAA